jgi:hypothetical protein
MLYRALDYTDEYLGFQFYPSELLSLIEATTTAIVAQVILVLSLLRETMIEVGEKRTWVSWWGPGQRLRAEKIKSETLIKKTDEILPTHKSEVPQRLRLRGIGLIDAAVQNYLPLALGAGHFHRHS